MGIGTATRLTLLEQVRNMGLKGLTLFVFASNERAVHVYEKVGFVETGLIPKKHLKDGRYIDEVTMNSLLE